MSDYSTLELPIFSNLKERLVKLRDEFVVPLQQQLEEARSQIIAQKNERGAGSSVVGPRNDPLQRP